MNPLSWWRLMSDSGNTDQKFSWKVTLGSGGTMLITAYWRSSWNLRNDSGRECGSTGNAPTSSSHLFLMIPGYICTCIRKRGIEKFCWCPLYRFYASMMPRKLMTTKCYLSLLTIWNSNCTVVILQLLAIAHIFKIENTTLTQYWTDNYLTKVVDEFVLCANGLTITIILSWLRFPVSVWVRDL